MDKNGTWLQMFFMHGPQSISFANTNSKMTI